MKKTLLLYLIASTPIYSATTIIKQNFQLPTKTFQSHKGSCFASSIASTRSDAYRCMVGNQIIDPCFTVKKQGYVVCNANQLPPTFQYVIKLDKPLAKNTNQNIKIKDQQPWLIQLKNGQYCTPFTGTRPFIDGKVLTYSCAPQKGSSTKIENIVSLTPGTTWKANLLKSQPVNIEKIWL